MIKILFLSANPKYAKQLLLDEEVGAIRRSLMSCELRQQFTFVQEWAPRVGDLQEHLMRHRPDIVHFSGNGSDVGEIILEDESGQSQAVPIAALRDLFAILRRKMPIFCVVLSSCFSERQAKAIAENIDCVVGMSSVIHNEAAISFAAAFYKALGFGEDIKTAFELARTNVHMEKLSGHDVPVLISRPGTDPARIFAAEQRRTSVRSDGERSRRRGQTKHTVVSKNAWSRGEKLTLGTLGVAVAAIVASLTIPELRAWLHLGAASFDGNSNSRISNRETSRPNADNSCAAKLGRVLLIIDEPNASSRSSQAVVASSLSKRLAQEGLSVSIGSELEADDLGRVQTALRKLESGDADAGTALNFAVVVTGKVSLRFGDPDPVLYSSVVTGTLRAIDVCTAKWYEPEMIPESRGQTGSQDRATKFALENAASQISTKFVMQIALIAHRALR